MGWLWRGVSRVRVKGVPVEVLAYDNRKRLFSSLRLLAASKGNVRAYMRKLRKGIRMRIIYTYNIGELVRERSLRKDLLTLIVYVYIHVYTLSFERH